MNILKVKVRYNSKYKQWYWVHPQCETYTYKIFSLVSRGHYPTVTDACIGAEWHLLLFHGEQAMDQLAVNLIDYWYSKWQEETNQKIIDWDGFIGLDTYDLITYDEFKSRVAKCTVMLRLDVRHVTLDSNSSEDHSSPS